jgi:hypothetical protein
MRDVCGRERRLIARTRDRHTAVHGLLAAGHSERETARILGLARGTVHRFAAAASADELLVKATTWPAKLDRCKPYLRRRWNEGITSAAALHAELQDSRSRPMGERMESAKARAVPYSGQAASVPGSMKASRWSPKSAMISRRPPRAWT